MTTERETPPAWVVFVVTVVLAGLFFCVPERVAGELRGWASAGLRPAQLHVAQLAASCREGVGLLAATRAGAEELRQARLEAERWENRYRELQFEFARRGTVAPATAEGQPSQALFVANLLEARVLGQTATNFLRKQQTLSIGSRAGVVVDAMVLDEKRPLVDQGAANGIGADQVVLAAYRKGKTAGRAVLGKIIHAGPSTSSVKLLTDPQFHEVAQIIGHGEQGPEFGARGLLDGTGKRLCKLSGIDAHAQVCVGDEVHATEGKGLFAEPLVYGRVVAAKVGPDGATWDIDVEPAANLDALTTVLVVRTELNPARLAEGNKPAATR